MGILVDTKTLTHWSWRQCLDVFRGEAYVNATLISSSFIDVSTVDRELSYDPPVRGAEHTTK